MDQLIEWFGANGMALVNVIIIDLVLAGDNAIIVGLAAAQVHPSLRARVIFWGIAGAVVLRIIFALLTTQLLQITGILLIGGLLLLWVCWKMYSQISDHSHADPHSLGAAAATADGATGVKHMSALAAIWQVIVADVSMSLDNVLAVAGAAKGSTLVLVIGLAVAIVMMAVASHYIASLLARYPWISWIGLLVILYVAIDMIYAGSFDVSCKTYNSGCDFKLMPWIQSLMSGK
jgi:YjbE family integral membrane protein